MSHFGIKAAVIIVAYQGGFEESVIFAVSRRVRGWLAFLVLLAAAAVAGTPGSTAAEDVFRVVIPKATLDTAAGTGSTLASAVETLTVAVSDATCATISLTDSQNRLPSGDKYVDLGLSRTQASGCAAPLGRVVFFDGRGRELWTELEFRPGATEMLTNLAPKPPGAATRGLLSGSVSVEGRGLLTGRSIESGDLFALIAIPQSAVPPVQLAIVEWAVVLQESGRFWKVLLPGQYRLAAAPRYAMANGDAVLQIQPVNGVGSISVRHVNVASGQLTQVDVIITAASIDATPVPVTAPRPGVAIQPPTSGDAGLRSDTIPTRPPPRAPKSWTHQNLPPLPSK